MKFFTFVAFFAFLAAVNAGLLAPAISAYSAPVLSAGLVGEQTVVAGPSGTITRTLGGPAIATPIVSSYAAAPLLARAIW